MKDVQPRCKKCGTIYIHLRDECNSLTDEASVIGVYGPVVEIEVYNNLNGV